MKSLRAAVQMLWSPGEAAPNAAEAGPWLPLAVVAAGGALAEWPRLIRLGKEQFLQARLDATPDGMYPGAALIYLALAFLAPAVLPGLLLLLGWLMDRYVLWVLDVKVPRAEVLRVVGYGFLPVGIERLLAGTIILLCGQRCNPINPLASNVAFFLDAKQTQVFWYELARGADAFSIWAIILIGKGLAALTEVPASRLYPGLAIFWAAGTLLRAWLLG